MKEYIFQPTIAQDGNAIVIADAPTGLIKKNILAIINKSTKGIIHSPLLDGIANLAYSGTTLTINLNAGHLSIQGDLLIKAYTDDAAGGYDEMIAAFFNLPEALPSGYHAMTTAEVLEIADDVWDAMYGFVAVPNTLHTVNALGQQVTIATYFKPSRTYGDYGFPELWAQNDQQQWVSILNDYPTADRDIYTYNPSNNE